MHTTRFDLDLDMTLNYQLIPGMFGKVKYSFIAITPRFTLIWSGLLVRVPSIDQTELFNHLLYLKSFNCVRTND